MSSAAARIEAKAPQALKPAAVITMSLFGLILLVPVLISMVIVSVLQFGILTFLVPLATILAATYFLPLGFGNPYLIWLLRKLPNWSAEKNDSFVVQLTRIPRQRTRLWSFQEDAYDILWLSIDESAVVFTGDAIQLEVPYELVEAPRQQTAGWRALFAYGSQTVFSIKGVPQAGTFLFAERGSFVLPTSRKIANRMYQKLLEKTERRDP
jgi:hypothetical protein